MKRAIFMSSILVLLSIAAMTSGPAVHRAKTRMLNPFLASNPTPINISNSATESDTPLVGVDGNGAAYVVWFEHQTTRSFYFATNKSGLWSTPQYIERIVYNADEAGYPWMDVSASGICHLIFQDGRTTSYDIFHMAYENNSWGPLTNVSNNEGGSCYAGVAFNPVDNYTYVVWQDGTGLEAGWNILLRFRSPGGSWGSTQLLPVGGGYMPKISIDGAGTAHMVWTKSHGRTLWYSKNRTPQNASSWTQPILIKQDAGEEWSYAEIACDDAGNAYIVWMDGTAGNDEIFLRKVNNNGTLGPEANVSQSAASSQEGSIAVNKKNGNILVAWAESNDIYANAFVGGAWSGPGNVTKGAAPSKMPRVAVDGSGGTHLVYSAQINGNWEIFYLAFASAILIQSPNGGEVWDPGTFQNITWISTGIPGNVKIEYSKDSGANYETLIAATENNGSYPWLVPNTPSTHCLVRVSEASTGSPSDVSDAVFTITGPIPCNYPLSHYAQAFSALGGVGIVSVMALGGCSWTATSNDAWITINSGNSGSGSGKVVYTVANNPGPNSRTGTMTVAGQTFSVIQTTSTYSAKSDFNSDGQEDVVWRYYGPGGYNVVWYMGYSGGSGLQAAVRSLSQVGTQGQRSPNDGKLGMLSEIDMLGGKESEQVFWDAREPGGLLEKTAWEYIKIKVPEDARTWNDPREGIGKSGLGIQGVTYLGTGTVPAMPDTNWEIVGTGDLNNDGSPDILWRYNGSGGYNVVWYMKGATFYGSDSLPSVTDPTWKIAGIGDFNRDGYADIFWHYDGPGGFNVVWYMKGVTFIGSASVPAVADTNWKIAGTGDFNNDGYPDILWWYNTPGGYNIVWYMNGVTFSGSASVPGVANPTWKIAGIEDLNKDGKVDILWRYYGPGGYNVVWYMNGVMYQGSENLNPVPDVNWRIQNH